MNIHGIILLTTLYLVSGLSHSADISPMEDRETWILNGELKPGDFESFLANQALHNVKPSMLRITSPGGSVDEAMKLGKFASDTLMTCWVQDQCNSSCFILLAACSTRHTVYPIGIHRPFFDPSHFGSLSFSQAKEAYDKLLDDVKKFLDEADVPQNMIEKMISTPSSSIHFISPDEFMSTVGERSPSYSEWLLAKCGALSKAEEEDHSIISSASLYEYLNQNPDSPLSKDITREDTIRLKDAYNHVKKHMSEGYREYLKDKAKKKAECAEQSLRPRSTAMWVRYMSENNLIVDGKQNIPKIIKTLGQE